MHESYHPQRADTVVNNVHTLLDTGRSSEAFAHIAHGEYARYEQRGIGKIHTVDVSGRPMQYYEYGNPFGVPLLTLGMGKADTRLDMALAGIPPFSETFTKLPAAEQAAMRSSIENISGVFRVISPVLSGWEGRKGLEHPTEDALGREIIAFMDKVGIEKALLYGQSHSGIAAMNAAAENPERVAALVLQAPPTRWSDVGLQTKAKLATVMHSPIGDFLRSNAGDSGVLNTVRRGILGDVDGNTIVSLLKEVGSDLTPLMERMQCPVVVVVGVDDTVILPREVGKSLKRFHPHMDTTEKYPHHVALVPIRDADHDINNKYPEAVAVATHALTKKLGMV